MLSRFQAIVIIFLTLAAYLHLRHKTVKQYDIR